MYKTIRHGENSLQYTILPQNDDFRIDGKLSSASSSGSCSKSKSKRSGRRRSFFAYIGLLFVCTVIIGAVLVPFLVSAECLPNPSDWFLKTKAAITGSARRIGATSTSSASTSTTIRDATTTTTTDARNNNKPIESTIQPYPVENSSVVEPQISDPQVDVARAGAGVGASEAASTVMSNSNDAKPSQDAKSTQDSVSRIGNDFVAEVRFEGLRGQSAASAEPTIVVTTARNNDQNKAAVIDEENLPAVTTTAMPVIKPIAMSGGQNITNRIMQVPLLKSASKKPIIPPVLAKTNSLGRESVRPFGRDEQQQDDKDKKNPDGPNDWIRSHWPYIDPSTYFQWTGYKAEDSVLLPAILGIALIVIILIIALCLVARNKRTIVSSVRKRNRNDIEEAGEDNTTLLTSSNLSDDD